MDAVEVWLRRAVGALRKAGQRGSRELKRWSQAFPGLAEINGNAGSGAVALSSYWCLGTIVAEPTVAGRLFPRRDVTNALVLTSMGAVCSWLWRRPHLAGTPPGRRLSWVALGGTTYVLGSVLMWAIIRSAVGRRPYLNVTLCSLAGAALTHSAVDYFRYLDRDYEPCEEISEEVNISDEDKYDLDL